MIVPRIYSTQVDVKQGTSWLGLSIADPVGGLLVAFMILRQGVFLSFSSLMELLDASPDSSIPQQVKLFLEAEERINVDKVRTFKSGGYTLVVIGVTLTGDRKFDDVLKLQKGIEAKVQEFLEGGVSEVLVTFTRT